MILIESMAIAQWESFWESPWAGISLYFEFNPWTIPGSRRKSPCGNDHHGVSGHRHEAQRSGDIGNVFVLAVLFSLLPARRAAGLNPIGRQLKL